MAYAALLLLVSCTSSRLAPSCRLVPARGLQVNVCEEGTGKPLVLLHGLGGSVNSWARWVDAFKNDHRVIRIDLPGSGKTGPSDDYSVEADTAVIREVLSQLGVEDFALAGHSLGGYRAWYLAAEDLTRPHVTELILIAPIGLVPKPNWFDRIPGPLLSLGRLFLPKHRKPVIDRLRWGDWHNYTCDLGDITARTLILWGDKDEMRGKCCFDQRIPDSTLVVVPNAGHLLVNKPETIDPARKFLDGTLDKRSPEICTEPCPAVAGSCQ